MKKIIALFVAMTLLLMLSTSCTIVDKKVDGELPTLDQLILGESYQDITAEIKILTFRTDIMDKLTGYADAFHELYPNITIKYEGVTDYEANTIMYLTSGIDWGDIMMIPVGIEKDIVSDFFAPLGKASVLSKIYNFTGAWTKDNLVYGIASSGTANGMIYNKQVFAEAGVAEIPSTPDEFIAALTAIKNNTDAIPLYTNYADEWPMSSWDAYMGINATGKDDYINCELVHANNPFSNHSDGTHPYAVYKILYDAVSLGLTEEDYTTTSESLCYGLINEGKIGCMAFTSWAVAQAQAAGVNSADIGLMPFPITINGKQYVSINGDYSYGVNVKSSTNEKIASMLYIKWLVHESGFDYSEGGLSVLKGGRTPQFYDSLKDCIFLEDKPAKSGEETYFDSLNAETGLLFNANGNAKGQAIVEHAFAGDKSFDAIMEEWNMLWRLAQDKLGIERNEP